MTKRTRLIVGLTAIAVVVVIVAALAIRYVPRLVARLSPTPVAPTPTVIAINPLQTNINPAEIPVETNSSCCGWGKYADNPVLGGSFGVIFDVTLLYEDGIFHMWNSWRATDSIGYSVSADGIHWSAPVVVLAPNPDTDWEELINRPSVVRREDGTYHMWYTGQNDTRSYIGYATSTDGKNWERMSSEPVMESEQPWEGVAVMVPSVIWDEETQEYQMWYSGGEQYEPDAIGYATSPDGMVWTKHPDNPIFEPDTANEWEQHKVTAAHVLHHTDGWYYMFYIGFKDVNTAHIGIARSRDGLTDWQRLPGNPILQPEPGAWDAEANYKPFVIWDGERWYLWYNGRTASTEQIGLAVHQGEDLGFPADE
jgi:predicted GH43/DUF377 family glycosyl hydrolase